MKALRPPGLHRVRIEGRLVWYDEAGRPVEDAGELARLAELAVPPAWREVWAAADPQAAVQATGVDARGRTQYRYLPAVLQAHAEDKFGALAAFGRALPSLRRTVADHVSEPLGDHPDRRPVLAAMTRLLDRGFFRVGSSRYLRDNHTYGLTTLRRDQVTITGSVLHFDYVAKEHLHRITDVDDADSARVVVALLAMPGTPDQPLFRAATHPRPPGPVSSATVNAYLHGLIGLPATAKAFRTWSGTVVAAAARAGAVLPGLATRASPDSPRVAVVSAAALLGNTPAVARTSYVHPAVLAGDPAPEVARAVDAVAEREGHRDLRLVWTDAGVQAAVAHQLEEVNTSSTPHG
ncbi:conserved hypothetical protein [Kribbella flavida DSM 17836]|uniref:DNA topoisomerase n=1 Tax=Kribbella flavida (strain DSM 17836 / JCM 10339 / NBRC 14399) TaxID=479435 RepID=D2PR95_KRIFD|nr:DNA topoisomerase IB [Kribbella flavida]ADB33043.1 conserved hypothetical protein [Kribbella flavida DSM 17836]